MIVLIWKKNEAAMDLICSGFSNGRYDCANETEEALQLSGMS